MAAYQIATAALMVIMVAIAVYTDIRAGKIYNALTAPCAVLGLALNLIGGGVAGLEDSLLGILTGLGIYLLASVLLGRILGGGDVKLLIAIGAIQGPRFLLWTCAYMAIIGGLLALLLALWRRDVLACLRRLGAGLFLRVAAGAKVDVSDASSTARLPYAIPIALGSLVALYVLRLQ